MGHKNNEVEVFTNGMNNLANRGNATTMQSWIEENCKRGHTDECPHLLEKNSIFTCAKSSFTKEQKENSKVECEGVPNLHEFELKVRNLAKSEHHFHPHESH